jgi:hypothetical protein
MRYWLTFSNANTAVTAVVDVLIAAVVSTLLLLLSNVLLSTFLIVSPWRNYLQCNVMRFIMVFTPRKAC